MKTDITFLLDRSGSMHNLVEDTIGGFNSLIEEQKSVDGEAVVTLSQFDNEFQTDFEGTDIQETPLLDKSTYVPRGTTALLDALGRTIQATKARLENSPADKVMIVIVTDGLENASNEFNKAQIKEMIEGLSEWDFVFTGANMDAIGEAASIGINMNSSLAYQASDVGTQQLYQTVSRGMTASRVSGEAMCFSDEDRKDNS